jgi:hypothetical protein
VEGFIFVEIRGEHLAAILWVLSILCLFIFAGISPYTTFEEDYAILLFWAIMVVITNISGTVIYLK